MDAHSGTIDNYWKLIQQALPQELAMQDPKARQVPGTNKKKKAKEANPLLFSYVYSFCTRYHFQGHPSALQKQLGEFLSTQWFVGL